MNLPLKENASLYNVPEELSTRMTVLQTLKYSTYMDTGYIYPSEDTQKTLFIC